MGYQFIHVETYGRTAYGGSGWTMRDIATLIDWQYDLYCEWLIEREKRGKGVLSLKPRLVASSVRVSVKNK